MSPLEPARKAVIVDLASAGARGRAVGLYYLIRGLAVFAAPLVGGWLWILDRRLPFYVALGAGAQGGDCRPGLGRGAGPGRGPLLPDSRPRRLRRPAGGWLALDPRPAAPLL